MGLIVYGATVMPEKWSPTPKQQLGVRIDTSLVVETKVLAARQQCRLNELVEEALRDLLMKYKEKKGLGPKGKS